MATEPTPPQHSGSAPPHDELRGALYIVAAGCCFAIGWTFIKQLTFDLPETMIALFRSLFAALCFTPLIVRRGLSFFATKHPLGHLGRSTLGFTNFILGIFAMAMLPMGDAVALSFTGPFFSILLAAMFLGERITPRLALTVAIGFAGVLLIAQPSGAERAWLGVACALTGAVASSFAGLTLKTLARQEPPDRIAFYFMACGVTISVVPATLQWRAPDLEQWLMLIATGVLFYFGQYTLTRAFVYGSFSRLAPLDYVRLPLTAVAGIVAFGERPTLFSLLGMGLILLAALDLLWSARRTRSPTKPD